MTRMCPANEYAKGATGAISSKPSACSLWRAKSANREAARPRQNQSDRIGHDKSAYLIRATSQLADAQTLTIQVSLLPINRSVSSEYHRLGVPPYFHTKHLWLTISRNAGATSKPTERSCRQLTFCRSTRGT